MSESITEMIIPGTYIDVRAEGLIGVGGIAVGNVGLVGTASKGPVNQVAILSSASQAREVFGDPDAWDGGTSGELTLVRALRLAFDNGATTVYAVRCAGSTVAAGRYVLLKGAVPVATVEAVTKGTWASAVSVAVGDASADGFVEKREATVADAAALPVLHAGIVASARNAIRVFRPSTGRTVRLPLAAGVAAAPGKPAVAADGKLSFAAEDAPKKDDVLTAAYVVGKASCRDVTLALGSLKEVFTVVDVDDLARDLAARSVLARATVATGKGGELPDKTTEATRLAGADDGAAATKTDYETALACLDAEPVNIAALAGAGFADALSLLSAHVEKAENAGRDRIAVIGASQDAVASVCGDADAVADDRIVLVAPGVRASDPVAGTDVSLPPAYTAAAVAGVVASLPVQASPTNKALRGIGGLTTCYGDGDLKKLLGCRVMPVERKSGYRIVKGITTDDGAFRQVSVRRIVDYAKAGVRLGAQPYIGKLNNARVRSALKATLNGFLARMVQDEALTEYQLDVTATRDDEIAGIAVVTLYLKPTFSIDYVKVIMNLA